MEPKQDNSSSNPPLNLPTRKDKVVEPLHANTRPEPENAAIKMIRGKLEALYAKEPSAKQELSEAEASKHRSKHQAFMHALSQSGKSLAEIQTAWHNYYVNLPDNEKHQVWQEFYSNYNKAGRQPAPVNETPKAHPPQHMAVRHKPASRIPDIRTLSDVKNQLLGRVGSRQKRQRSAHLKSLIFGFSMGSVVLLIMLFGFFNERFIAPFITPSRHVSSTPIILDSETSVGNDPKIIIPKINAEYPVIYDEESIDEAAVQRALEGGVLHYPTTVNPGELGNAAIFGHSSNNILNSGKYKFAFVLLNKLESGDTFMLHYQGKRYVYRVYEKKIVKPEEISVLGDQGRPATVALITCDPPGTAINRLVVFGEQITPDPAKNVASSVKQDQANRPAILPSNAPSLWSRLWGWISS